LSHAYLAETCLTYLTLHIHDLATIGYGYAALNWVYHTRETEHEPAVQKAAFILLRKEMEGISILHFLARAGLATLCKILLNDDIM